MGEAFSCPNESAFSTVIATMATLTPEQRSAIQQTWSIPAQNPVDSGGAILLAFFERFPRNQQKFPAFKNVPLDSLKVIVECIYIHSITMSLLYLIALYIVCILYHQLIK